MEAKDMAGIIERLEAASGPDRDDDGAIWRVADPDAFKRNCEFKGMMYAGHMHTQAEKREYTARQASLLSPKYTSSIDSALSLVPEGISWTLERDGDWYRASMLTKAHTAYRSPAIALCIAALRARAQNGEG